ncbi:DNA-binding transcriptional LysR family regulator [Rhizobium sp. SJZ105]|uniref:LysR family transcriptional regulator n=1 Tax=Rhizobium sp. SJZ105 TaxID=2572678 RepID=UPI0011A9FEA2|nr:LysR family transcriptional regulator [Rhizobium sp. SJZ105]TWC77275.1 DNA-binding transcriptional LysR family regulator [Rhizobium sp. SJZ105]
MARSDEIFRTVAQLPPGEISAFLAVVEHGGFRPAARAIGNSPSALSHAVAGLEARLKVQLIVRTTRNVSLTEAGERFAEALRPALQQLGAALGALEDYSDQPRGTIRINASAGAVSLVLETLILGFLRQYPDMQLDVRSDDALLDLGSAGFDCGLRLMDLVPEEMVAIPVGGQQQHVVVAAPTYLQTRPPLQTPADLAGHNCIQLRLGKAGRYRWEFVRHGVAFSQETEGQLIVDDGRLVPAAALAGFGVGYVLLSTVEEDLAAGRLVQCLKDWTPPYPGMALYYARNRHMSAGMRAFVAFVRALR